MAVTTRTAIYDQGCRPISITITAAQRAQLDALGKNRSAVVRVALQQYFQRMEKKSRATRQ